MMDNESAQMDANSRPATPSPHMSEDETTRANRSADVSAGGNAAAAILALTLAGVAEYLLRTTESVREGIGLYIAAILLLAASARPFVFAPARTDAHRITRRGWFVLICSAVASCALAVVIFLLLQENLRDPRAFWLWLAAPLPLVIGALLVRREETPHALWRAEMPRSARGHFVFLLTLAIILVGAIAARFLWLESIPFGINADEGDRAAVAIQVVRGTTNNTIFEAGWYYISMVYFYILALAFDWFGIGYVQARAFTAVWGVLTVAGVMWIGARNWSWRVGLLAGAFTAFAGVLIHFSRLTTEAGPTAALWVLSIALLLEGARTGRSLPWVLAGFAGGFSLYFYPTGRVWAILALLIGCYLLARWLLARRSETLALLRGLVLAALMAIVVAAPYFAWLALHPHELTLRYEQTTIFSAENVTRLGYVDSTWSTPRLVLEQLARTLGIFSLFSDGGGIWRIEQPIFRPILAVLVLTGLGLCCLRWRDPRAVLLALWFWVGTIGVVITVETPNLIRMATAVPVLGLLAALTLEEVIVRVRAVFARPIAKTRAMLLTTSLAALVLAVVLVGEVRFYFTDYARMNLWAAPNQEGRALRLLPEDTLYLSLGNSYHMVNSGWVRLLAPDADRAGVKAPGSVLPLPNQDARNVGILVYPEQVGYLPWLRNLYPHAIDVPYALPEEGSYFTLLHLPARAQELHAGATLYLNNEQIPVAQPGALPANMPAIDPKREATWRSTVRIPQQWNYHLRVTGGAARLALDGRTILQVSEGSESASALVSLARGDHELALVGSSAGHTIEIARHQPNAEPVFVLLDADALRASDGTAHGLLARVQIDGRSEQLRQDNALATCCFSDLVQSGERPVNATWQGSLLAPTSGAYGLRLVLPGAGALLLDGTVVARVDDAAGGTVEARTMLTGGAHAIEVTFSAPNGARGGVELAWELPAAIQTNAPADTAVWSIIPHTSLSPLRPDQSGPALDILVGAPIPDDYLQSPGAFPADQVYEIVR